VEVTVVLTKPQFNAFDVDNLLKDIFDALQGRLAGESKGRQRHKAAIFNDRQIVRVSVEKLVGDSPIDKGGVLLVKRLLGTLGEASP
jgi:Holliday junction resolvase RusA-like endonuclease